MCLHTAITARLPFWVFLIIFLLCWAFPTTPLHLHQHLIGEVPGGDCDDCLSQGEKNEMWLVWRGPDTVWPRYWQHSPLLSDNYTQHYVLLYYMVLFNLFLSCTALSSFVMSCLVLLCLVLSCLVLSSWLVLPCLTLFRFAMSCLFFCLVLSCFALFCLVLSCLVLAWLVLNYLFFFPCLVLSCFFLSSLDFSWHAWSCLVLFDKNAGGKRPW